LITTFQRRLQIPPIGESLLVVIEVHLPGQVDLMEIGTTGRRRSLSLGPRQGGEEQRRKDGHDRDDHEQLDQREATMRTQRPRTAEKLFP
jgi:hypothetical protein